MAQQCGYSVPTAERLDSSAVGIAYLVAHEVGESVLYVRGGYAALHKLLKWHQGDRTYCLIFAVLCRPNSNLVYFNCATLS